MSRIVGVICQGIGVVFFLLAFLIWLAYELGPGSGPAPGPLFHFSPGAIFHPIIVGRLINSVFVITAATIGVGFWQFGKNKSR